jgi:hypothetical protein
MSIEHNIEQAKKLKLLLYVFQHLSGLKINFHKNKLICYGEAKEWELDVLWGNILSNIYLGISVHHKKLSNVDEKIIEENFEKRLSC